MYFLLEKILQKFIWPETLVILSMLIAIVALSTKRTKLATRALWIALVLLLIPSIPLVASNIMGRLEAYYPSRPVAEYPQADVIVVLGGSTEALVSPRQEPEEMSGSRILPAARLYRAGKAKYVMACGGIPYTDIHKKTRTLADDIHDILVDEGVPSSAIILENDSRTTREDAFYASQIFAERNFKSALLVTSAFHLRRAAELFKRSGIEIIPVPVGHYVTSNVASWDFFVPDVKSLWLSTVAWKEYVGNWVDQIF